MTFGSLFAGIGGFDLGFERAGMTCSWQVEINPYCQRVLAKHWPDVRRHDDVCTFPPAGDWSVDVICGGFPCQDISNAGKLAGIDGERSGLWSEYVRIIRHLRPSYVVVENVAALTHRGLDRVLGELAESGFDAEWDMLPASAFGAPHRRGRVFVVAYPQRNKQPRPQPRFWPVGRVGRIEQSVAWDRDWEAALSALRGMDDGLSRSVDRTDGLRNAVVPQVAEWIGRRLIRSAEERELIRKQALEAMK